MILLLYLISDYDYDYQSKHPHIIYESNERPRQLCGVLDNQIQVFYNPRSSILNLQSSILNVQSSILNLPSLVLNPCCVLIFSVADADATVKAFC